MSTEQTPADPDPADQKTDRAADGPTVRHLPALRREALVPTSDRARLAAILATCSLAGLAGGLALSMVAGAQHAASSMRSPRCHGGAAAAAARPVTWLGVQITDACDADSCDGARIRRVIPGSPADRAGFRPGDVVREFHGDPIRTADELILSVRATRVGTPVDVTITRGAVEAVLAPELAAMPRHIRAQID